MRLAYSIEFQPLFELWLLVPAVAVMALFVLWGITKQTRGAWWRALFGATVALALFNPSAVSEERRPVKDVAIVVVDESPSQALGDRQAVRDAALASLEERLGTDDTIDLRVIRASGLNSADGTIDETRLFNALDKTVADIPRRRLAGTILLSDGQVHDAPEVQEDAEKGALGDYGPLHLLLTGSREDKDRRLSLVAAPAYGLVGREVDVTLRVDDLPEAGNGGLVSLRMDVDGVFGQNYTLSEGEETTLTLEIKHGGQNVFEFEVETLDGEMTLANNKVAVIVNGVRDRLRVLLVSGLPHNGERVWRNILKSDPSVDLVHFTILRPAEKRPMAPIHEMSLISFPVHDLFEVKLHEFDLIIFDRYRRRGLLGDRYLANIADYVREGGALLAAGGPDMIGQASIYDTALAEVMPADATRRMIEQSFRPQLTDLGLKHPVTAGLTGGNPTPSAEPRWGQWYRMVQLEAPERGMTVMNGPNASPLLILDRVGEGRVALMASDHIWLWARGHDDGGPQAELLRRTAHWLMKEPELEETDLKISVNGTGLVVERRAIEGGEVPVTLQDPEGAEIEGFEMEEARPGVWRGTHLARTPGIWRATDGERVAVAVVGRVNAPESRDVRATNEKLAPVLDAANGSTHWLEDGQPDIRRIRGERATTAGDDWIGLKANDDYVVTATRSRPLMAGWPMGMITLLLLIGSAMAAWYREGK